MGIIGIVGYALTGVVYLSSGLVVPAPWLVVLWAIWLVGIYPLVVVFRTRRAWTLLVAVGACIIWWVYVTIGGALFDWTA
jgi:hypothetical protein